jgi:hypothetical protein
MHALRLSRVPWDVFFTVKAEEWILGLDDTDYEAIMAAIELLEEKDPALGRPAVDRIEGSRHHHMKEMLRSAASCVRSSPSTPSGARSSFSAATDRRLDRLVRAQHPDRRRPLDEHLRNEGLS